ncbi:MAG: hypothetical protein P8Y72_13150 [Anaerolineales bacterium]
MPAWLIYVALYLVYLIIDQSFAWLEQTTAVGQFELRRVLISIWPTLTLVILNYLDRVALAASKEFRPLRVDDEDYSEKVFRLTNMPSGSVWILTAIGPILVILSYSFDLEIVKFADRTTISLVAELVRNVIGLTLFLVFVFHTIRQMTIVSQMQSDLTEIDLFNSTPLYAFSILTSRTGIAWVFLLSTSLTFLYLSGTAYAGVSTALIITFITSEIMLALASFILPLVSLHAQMEKAKGRLIDEINMYMKTSIDKMESELKILDPGKASAKRDLVETLKMQQSYVRELRTWPWKSETLRGFLSVIFLPILITVIQQLIERLF